MAVRRLSDNALSHVPVVLTTEGYGNTLLELTGGTIHIGPVAITYDWTVNPPQLTFTIFLLGVKVGSGTIDPANPRVTIGGTVDGYSVEVTLSLHMNPLVLEIDLKACAPVVGCRQKTITIHL